MPGSCYCDSGKAFADCCEPFLDGRKVPPTAVALMRSRYSAFATGNTGYLEQSWHAKHQPESLQLNADQQWIGLKVLDHYENGDTAGVHFIARYKIAGKGYRMEENSLFSRVDGRWYYCEPDPTIENNL